MATITDSQERYRGYVKWFSTKLNYGFITRTDKDEDYFVHFSDIVTGEKYKVLREQEYVEFSLGVGDNGKVKAMKVIVLPPQGRPEPTETQEVLNGKTTE